MRILTRLGVLKALAVASVLLAVSFLGHSAQAQVGCNTISPTPGVVYGNNGSTSACTDAYVDPTTHALTVTASGGSAPTPALVTITDRSRSLSTASATVAAANSSRTTLTLQNLDAAINECYSFTGAAVCGAAGTYTLFPGQTVFWPAGSAPRLAITAISASGTPVISAYEGQ